MVYVHVMAALTWLVMTALMAINWWFDEPLSPIGQVMVAYGMVYTLGSFVTKATDAVESAIIRRHRHLDRRPQI